MNLTVGPHPSAVYWRRRAIVAAPLLLILVTLSTCLASGSDGSPPRSKAKVAPGPTPTTVSPSPAGLVPTWSPSPTPSGSPSVSPTPAGPVPCADTDLTLVGVVDKTVYPAGAQPRFKLIVSNSSSRPCVRDVGSGHQEMWVGAAGKKLWSSDHCSPNRGSDARTLQPGEKRTYWLTWSARTSDVGCPKGRQQVGPGPYELFARVGTLVSKPVAFTIK